MNFLDLLHIPYQAWCGRWGGGGWPVISKFSLPFTDKKFSIDLIKKAAWALGPAMLFWGDWYLFSISILAGLWLADMGKADFFYWYKGWRDQTATKILKWIWMRTFDQDGVFDLQDRQDMRYDFMGFMIIGMASVIVPCGLLIYTGEYLYSGILLLSGAMEAVVYLPSQHDKKRDKEDRLNVYGEWGRGAVVGIAIVIIKFLRG